MLRIIVREVSEGRLRSPKSLGIADIEPFLPLTHHIPSPGKDCHLATFYLCLDSGEKKIAAVQFVPTVTPTRNLWRYIAEAITSTLPPRDSENLSQLGKCPGGN